ncbi:MAG TPA: aminotransferase class I/II-fold pyridoxal phosphate-dependent enzyme, partial [Candidatus Tumulicola sp.]|nr:aminotransferase class I/II-fold pyridoxal phosphate-dependent enzyme [Candidatus Tumulicola sp.]
PPSACAAVLACIEILRAEPERRERLWAHGRRMRRDLKGLGFDVGAAEAPIVPVIIGGDLQTFAFWRRLYEGGVFANPVISPAVPENSARIRTSYIATHTADQLDFVLDVFDNVGKHMGVI